MILIDEAYRLHNQAGQPEEARETVLAVWALGQRGFENNVRMFNRLPGLTMMGTAEQWLMSVAKKDAALDVKVLSAWAAAIKDVQTAWRPKLQVILNIDPPIGDLINIAQHDKDRTFRIAATQRLGIAKFTGNSDADQQAAKDAIASLKKSDDALVAEAAQAADALTLQQLKRIH